MLQNQSDQIEVISSNKVSDNITKVSLENVSV